MPTILQIEKIHFHPLGIQNIFPQLILQLYLPKNISDG